MEGWMDGEVILRIGQSKKNLMKRNKHGQVVKNEKSSFNDLQAKQVKKNKHKNLTKIWKLTFTMDFFGLVKIL